MSINKNNEKCAICSKNDITHLLVKGIGQFPNYIEKLICNECNEWIDSLSPYELDELQSWTRLLGHFSYVFFKGLKNFHNQEFTCKTLSVR